MNQKRKTRGLWSGAIFVWCVGLCPVVFGGPVHAPSFRPAPHISPHPVLEHPYNRPSALFEHSTSSRAAELGPPPLRAHPEYKADGLHDNPFAEGTNRRPEIAAPPPSPPDPVHEALEIDLTSSTDIAGVFRQRFDDSKAGNVFVSSPEAIPVARQVLAARGDTQRLVIYKRSDGPVDGALRSMLRPVSRVETFYSIPADSREAAVVHGSAADAVGPQYWAKQRTTIERQLNADTTVDIGRANQNGESAALALKKRLEASEADLIVVIAENRGGALRFPDGSVLPTADVGRPGGKLVAVLGCTSARSATPRGGAVILGTGRQITYPQAIDLAKTIDAEARSGKPFVTRDLLLRFQNSSKLAEQSMLGVAILEVGVTASATILDWVYT